MNVLMALAVLNVLTVVAAGLTMISTWVAWVVMDRDR